MDLTTGSIPGTNLICWIAFELQKALCRYFDRRIAGMEAAGKRSRRNLARPGARLRDAAIASNIPLRIQFLTFWTGNWILQSSDQRIITRQAVNWRYVQYRVGQLAILRSFQKE